MSIYEPASPDVTKWREDAEKNQAKYCDEIDDTSPFIEMICQFWWFIKFMGFASLFFFCVFVAWAVFERFYPSTHCMILQIFNFKCKE